MDVETQSAQILGILRPEDLEVLLNLSFRCPYARGEVVVAAGEKVDRFYLVEQGVLRVDPPPGGEPKFLHPGQVIGSPSLLQQRPAPQNVLAADDVIVLSLSPELL